MTDQHQPKTYADALNDCYDIINRKDEEIGILRNRESQLDDFSRRNQNLNKSLQVKIGIIETKDKKIHDQNNTIEILGQIRRTLIEENNELKLQLSKCYNQDDQYYEEIYEKIWNKQNESEKIKKELKDIYNKRVDSCNKLDRLEKEIKDLREKLI